MPRTNHFPVVRYYGPFAQFDLLTPMAADPARPEVQVRDPVRMGAGRRRGRSAGRP